MMDFVFEIMKLCWGMLVHSTGRGSILWFLFKMGPFQQLVHSSLSIESSEFCIKHDEFFI